MTDKDWLIWEVLYYRSKQKPRYIYQEDGMPLMILCTED